MAPLFASKPKPSTASQFMSSPQKRTVEALPPTMSHKRTKVDAAAESMPLAAKGNTIK